MTNRTSIKSLSVLFILGCIILISACSRLDAGGDLLGKWVNTKSPEFNLIIERNGDGFIVRKTQADFLSGGIETVNIPATLKDGVLQTSHFSSLSLDHASGKLTDGKSEYRRDKQ